MRKLFSLVLFVQTMLLSGQPNYPREVSEAQLIFSDLENFGEYLSKLTVDCDTISLLNRYYFDRASAGLKEYMSRHNLTDSLLLSAMIKYPERYLIVDDVINQRAVLEQRYQEELRFYQTIVKDVVIPPTYLLVGANRGIGQGSREGQLVTIIKVADDHDKLFSMIIHELSHFQQARTMGFQAYGSVFQKPGNMLDLVLREGTADFLTYGVGRKHAGNYHRLDYLNDHEEDLVDRFVHDLHNQDQSFWLWESLNSTSVEPSLLGYAMGFKICSSYYQKSEDKSVAIVDMLLMEDPVSFLNKSEYLEDFYPYRVNKYEPFGLPHPEAPDQIKDYIPLIGICDCQSQTRGLDGTWGDTVDMQWTFKYIMNGMAVQDETLKADGRHSGSIRQYNVDSARWYVHYFSSSSSPATLSTWEGGIINDEIILNRPQKSPNGLDGKYKIRFYNISQEGFDWLGAWTTPDESTIWESWKIHCRKRSH